MHDLWTAARIEPNRDNEGKPTITYLGAFCTKSAAIQATYEHAANETEEWGQTVITFSGGAYYIVAPVVFIPEELAR